MTSPSVVNSASSIESANVSSHDVSLPASIVTNRLLLASFSISSTQTVDWPTGENDGFTELLQVIVSGMGELSVAYRWTNGSEPATVTVTSGKSKKSSHCVYQIDGAENPATQAPEISTGAEGVSANPDPDSITGTGGPKDFLAIALYSQDKQKTLVSVPSGYGDDVSATVVDDTGNTTAMGAKELTNVSSENPGIFTTSGSDDWRAHTIFVHPSAVAAGIPDIHMPPRIILPYSIRGF